MKPMFIFRMVVVSALVWCGGLQHVEAGKLLTREDSVALERLYNDYVTAVERAYDKMTAETESLGEADNEEEEAALEAKRDDIYSAYEEEVERLAKRFDVTLASNPSFKEVARLRNILKQYLEDKDVAKEKMYDAYLSSSKEWKEGENLMDHLADYKWEYLAPFEMEWDGKLIELIGSNPDFLEYPEYMFEEVVEDIVVATSPDGRLRYYSWPTDRGGTMINIVCFRQYRADNGQVLVSWDTNRDGDDDWEWSEGVGEIYMLNANGKNIYLLEKWANRSTLFAYFSYHAEAIEGKEITHPKVFDTDNEEENGLVVEYKFPNCEEAENLNDDWVVRYDEDTRTIYAHVCNPDENMAITNDYNVYQFNGKTFKLTKKIEN